MPDLLPFEEVYRRHADDVFRFCLFQMRDRTEAEDIASATFLSALASYERVAPAEDTVRFWLIRIAKNDIIDHRRRAQRWRQVMVVLRRDSRTQVSEVEGLVDVNERLRLAISGMGSLPKRDQLLLGLRCGAGLSFEEVGKMTGMSTKSATTATHRAMQRLRANPEVFIK